jgi:hypothetical protein
MNQQGAVNTLVKRGSLESFAIGLERLRFRDYILWLHSLEPQLHYQQMPRFKVHQTLVLNLRPNWNKMPKERSSPQCDV